MPSSLFGFRIHSVQDEERKKLKSFVAPLNDDGALNIKAGGTYGSYIDLDGTVRSESQLVTKYRNMALSPEVEKAIQEICNESIIKEDDTEIVELILDDFKMEKTKKIIQEEFANILKLIKFEKNAYEIFRRWYIDGRLFHNVVIDEKNPQEGIKELRYIDPRKISKVRITEEKVDKATGVLNTYVKEEYYLYSEKGWNNSQRTGQTLGSGVGSTGVKILKDSIVYTTSGLMDENNTVVLSYLHPAIKDLNQLRALENGTMIYFLSRAPERRAFYIEVGDLPKMKAEQYVSDLMTRFKNRVSYNAITGEITDQRKFMHMNEDFWFPTRAGQGTKIEPISGGERLPDLLDTVQHWQDKLYRSLQVPLTRMKPDAITNIGRATEITRDEVNFSKFIDRIRLRFMEFPVQALRTQLILKGIIVPKDWDEIADSIQFRFARDNYFAELKESEILNDRLMRAQEVEQFVGIYYSRDWVRRKILKMRDDEIKEQEDLIDKERGVEMPSMQQQMLPPPEGGDGSDMPYQTAPQPIPQDVPNPPAPNSFSNGVGNDQ